jgi:hypothetical protein
MSVLTSALILVLLASVGFVAYTWAIMPHGTSVERLSAIALREHAARVIPATRLAQLAWLAHHRLTRLARWRTVLAAALLAASTEGWLWRRRQTFRGYHRMLWLSGGMAMLVLLGTVALFATAPLVAPTTSILPVLLVLVIGAGFAVMAGFPAVR